MKATSEPALKEDPIKIGFAIVAMLARIFLTLVGAVWGSAAALFLLGLPSDAASEPIAIFTVMVAVSVSVAMGVAIRSRAARLHLSQGPKAIQKHPMPVLAAGIVSAAGGQVLFMAGHQSLSQWVLNLTCLLIVFEVTALLGNLWFARAR